MIEDWNMIPFHQFPLEALPESSSPPSFLFSQKTKRNPSNSSKVSRDLTYKIKDSKIEFQDVIQRLNRLPQSLSSNPETGNKHRGHRNRWKNLDDKVALSDPDKLNQGYLVLLSVYQHHLQNNNNIQKPFKHTQKGTRLLKDHVVQYQTRLPILEDFSFQPAVTVSCCICIDSLPIT